MSSLSFHTLLIQHNSKTKKFQWKNSYSMNDLKTLLQKIFSLSSSILGLLDKNDNFYDLSYFNKNPHCLENCVYRLVLEEEKLENSENFDLARCRGVYIGFLERALNERKITDEEFFYLKCLSFEQPDLISLNFDSFLKEANYQDFLLSLSNFLTLKRSSKYSPSKEFTSPQNFKLSPSYHLSPPSKSSFLPSSSPPPVPPILPSPSLLPSSLPPPSSIPPYPPQFFGLFSSHQSSSYPSSHLAPSTTIPPSSTLPLLSSCSSGRPGSRLLSRPKSPNPGEGELILLVENFGKGRGEEGRWVRELLNERNEILMSGFEVYKTNRNLEDFEDTLERLIRRRKDEGKEKIKKEEKISKNMLDLILKTFLEETEKEFDAFEIGFIKSLYAKSDPGILKILNESKTIEEAISLCKEATKKSVTEFLESYFSESEKNIIETLTNEKNNEIIEIFQTFKSTGSSEALLSTLRALLHSKTTDKKFSNAAAQRNKGKRGSFRMMLHKESSPLLGKEVNEELNMPLIVTLAQEENAEVNELLGKYFGNDDQNHFCKLNDNILAEIFEKADFLSALDQKKLSILLKNNNASLLQLLKNFENCNRQISKIKKGLKKILAEEDYNENMNGDNSPISKSKNKKFNIFKQIINQIQIKYHLISLKQAKLFLYLFIKEDLAVLGAYEVFCLTNELQDFVENLTIIDKFNYFKTRLDFEEIEQFDNQTENQLEILFIYKKHLNLSQRENLEKSIRAGDQDLLKLHREFLRNQNKDEFIKKMVNLAEENSKKISLLEEKIKESQLCSSVEKKRLDTIDTFRQSKFLKKIIHMELITLLVEQNDKRISSVFEIYSMNKNKEDFIENLTMIYQWAYKENFKKIIIDMKNHLKLKRKHLNFLYDCVENDIPNVLAPYEIFMFSDEPAEVKEKELKESIQILIRIYRKEIDLLQKKFY